MSLSLTEPQRVFRGILIEVARGEWPDQGHFRNSLSYRELGEEAARRGLICSYPMLTPPFRGMGAELGVVSSYEAAFGRPLLSALVIQEASGQPGPGFVDLAERLGAEVGTDHKAYVSEEQRLIRDFWRDPDPSRIIDAGLSAVLEQLQQIRRDLKRGK